ncbi:hypothetical protein QFC19_003683 [Naganishia cerealis]|uniref:Uncharacterized protein n=1 Tax=Naganishia cerealis TaxID=610337 RepID=A0ACC2W0Z8_9TREE|nr:hypothetical protein QFC19_003683 [Naganishia cerealis]
MLMHIPPSLRPGAAPDPAVMSDSTARAYQPPTLRTYAQRKREKERSLALAAGRHPDDGQLSDPSGMYLPQDHAPHPQMPGRTEYEQRHPGNGPLATTCAQHVVHGSTASLWSPHTGNATPLPLIPSGIFSGTSSPSNGRPLPSPATHAVTNRISTTPAILHQRASDVSPGLHHYASQPNLTLHRATGYRPQPDFLPAYSDTIRSAPSIPNMRNGHISSSPINPSLPVGLDNSLSRQGSVGASDASHRPLPKPLKTTRSSTLQRIPEPSDVQMSSLCPSTSLDNLPRSAPVTNPEYGPSWTPSISSSSQTLPSAVMDRSDTLTSVKSLDRWDLSQQGTKQTQLQTATMSGKQRPLPSPPGLVDAKTTLAISRSLDRGVSRQGVQALRSLAEGPIRDTRRHAVGSASGAESGKSTRTEPELGTATPPSGNTFPGPAPSPLEKPASGQAVGVLRTLHDQVTSAMAEFRIDGMPVDAPSRSVTAVALEVRPTMTAGPMPTETVAVQANVTYPAQEAAISPIQIPTIIFPDSDETSRESIMTPAVVRPSSPGPFAKYTTAPPAIAIINVDDAESTATPTISVSEDGVAQRVKDGIESPTSDLPPPPRDPSGISERSIQAIPPPLPSASGIFCHSCDLVILGNIVNAMEKGWHPACFKCTTCGMPLEHVSSFEHEGKPYCHMDYHEVRMFPCLVALGLLSR